MTRRTTSANNGDGLPLPCRAEEHEVRRLRAGALQIVVNWP
jgi:hypothetical protein